MGQKAYSLRFALGCNGWPGGHFRGVLVGGTLNLVDKTAPGADLSRRFTTVWSLCAGLSVRCSWGRGFARKPVGSPLAFDSPSGAEPRAFFDLPNETTTPSSNWQKFGRLVNEPFGACSKTNPAGEVRIVDSREDTRRSASPPR